jgi:predicted phosphodiesterase
MFWTNDQIAGTVGVLKRSSNVLQALPEIERITGRTKLTYQQVKHALTSRGYQSPAKYLNTDLVSKRANQILDLIYKEKDRDTVGRLSAFDSKGKKIFDVTDFDIKFDHSPWSAPPAFSTKPFTTSFEISDQVINPPKVTKIMVCPDAHHPYVDKRAWKTFLVACKDIKPDVLVIIGDFADCYAVSSHAKDPSRKSKLKWEIDQVNKALDQISALGIKRVIFCEGNHETRLTRFIASEASTLYGMLEISQVLKIKERGWEWVPYNDWIRIGKISFTHDVGRCGANAGRQSLADFGSNLVFGHTHRGSVTYAGTTEGDTHVCLNVGWLGDFDSIDYKHKAMARREWTHGFGYCEQTENGVTWCNFIPIIKGRCVVDGKVIQA